jgi:hypothetical protein
MEALKQRERERKREREERGERIKNKIYTFKGIPQGPTSSK